MVYHFEKKWSDDFYFLLFLTPINEVEIRYQSQWRHMITMMAESIFNLAVNDTATQPKNRPRITWPGCPTVNSPHNGLIIRKTLLWIMNNNINHIVLRLHTTPVSVMYTRRGHLSGKKGAYSIIWKPCWFYYCFILWHNPWLYHFK